VELIRAFRRAADALDVDLTIHGTDASRLSPASYHVDKAHLVAPIRKKRYTRELLEIVTKTKIDMLVPLIDSELQAIADAADDFRAMGCIPLISGADVIRTCSDKLRTFEVLSAAGIDTPRTWPLAEVTSRKRHRFPSFMKPRAGSAAQGNFKIHDKDELRVLGRRVNDPIVQEFVDGVEYTCDVYTGLDGKVRCVVPRRRLEVRTGEVSKALVVKRADVMNACKRVVAALGECRGVVTIQCMITPEDRVRVLEINPRFGGGAPLAIAAGADFPKWLLMELLGEKPRIRATGFRNGMGMLRFDDSVFLPGASRYAPRNKGT
jgi:carbamoyl-phosphate synthase large subunit